MKNTFRISIGIIVLIVGASLLYIIGKDSLKKDNSILKYGISYYDNKRFEAAEQVFQREADRGNRETYPYLGHTKLILNKNKEAEKYLLLALEDAKDNTDTSVKQNILFNLGSVYLNLREDSKAKTYLQQSSKLGNKEVEKLLIKYDLV